MVKGSPAGCEQSGLAGIRDAHQAYVCHQLQLQIQPPLIPRLTLLGKGWRGHARCLEVLVAPSARPTAGHQQSFPVCVQLSRPYTFAVSYNSA